MLGRSCNRQEDMRRLRRAYHRWSRMRGWWVRQYRVCTSHLPQPLVQGVTRPKLTRMSRSERRLTPIHIERWSSDGADPATSQYILTFGGPSDGVGTVLLSTLKGLLAVREFLESLGLLSPDVDTACRVPADR